jgi:Mg2+/citrate symporter
MIKFTKYFYANIIATMGVIILLASNDYPILFGFMGGWFVGIALKLAREYGKEEK